MLAPIASDDEVVRIQESPEAFEMSSRLFYAADKLRYEEQNETVAEKTYRDAMAATTTHGVFYHLAQGQIYSMRQNIEYALTEFEIAAEINDQIDSVFVNLGLTYRKLAGHLRSLNLNEKAAEMMQESVASLRRALEINPENAGAWSALAITYLKMGHKYQRDAENCVDSARSLDQKSYMALTALTNLRRQQGRKEEARQHALEAIALRPDHPDAYGLLGARESTTWRLEEKPKNSITWLEKALERQPHNSYLLSEMGKAYRELNDYDEAIKWFDKALRADESGEQQYGKLANRGDAYRLAKRFDQAEADLRRALTIRPDYTFAIASLMKLRKEQKRHEEAVTLVDSLLARNDSPQNRQQQKELETLFQRDRRESIELTQRLIQSRADVKAEATGREAQRARQLFSRNHDAWGIIGRYLTACGDLVGAKKCLDQALTLKPEAYFYRLILGQVLERLGEWTAAEREYQAFNSRTEHNERGREGLRRVREHLRLEQRRKQQSGTDAEIVFVNNKTGREEHHPLKIIREFLYDRMNGWNLPIRDIIEQIGDEPVFIIAKTGVGKTVTVPTKVLLGLCDNLQREGANLAQRYPQVYVVEPRIPICTMTMAEMNEGYQHYLAYRMKDNAAFRAFLVNHGVVSIDDTGRGTVDRIVELAYRFGATREAPYDPRHFNLYGCITSATGKINADAPILFVTTGIMESLTFEGNKLDPEYHRIIIDEAHVTIEANPAIELGIALARKQGINIDYMSATVAPGSLATDLGVKIVYAEAQRFPIYLTNLRGTVEEKILDLVAHFLLDPDPLRFPNPQNFADPTIRGRVERVCRHLLSQENFEDDGKKYLGLKNRAQGMLVIVNSHQSENSDTHRIADLVARADFNRDSTRVHTLRLASPVVRDPAQKLAFDRLIRNIEDQGGRYVIVATNVVEMGLTFSSLDYVVTMDSEFDTEFVDGGEMITKVGLGVNALYQRIGRAGRIRPGMAFIARDFGASYCDLDDATLAMGLPEAPIRYPLAKGSFLKLALYTFREGIPETQLRQAIADLHLPSHIEANTSLWDRFVAERARLRRIGIAMNDGLSPLGKRALSFIGLDDMDFAKLLASVIERYGVNSDFAAILTVAAASASSEVGFSDLMVPRYFLTNPKQLSAMELFHADALGVAVREVYRQVQAHENDADQQQLHSALQALGVDERLCNDICSLVRDGYGLVSRDDPESTARDLAEEEVDSGANLLRANDNEIEDDITLDLAALGGVDSLAEPDEEELSADLIRELERYSADRTLAFERAVVSFSDQTDLINIYRIYRHFFNNYFSALRAGTLSSLESSELRRTMDDEAEKLQISPRALTNLNARFEQFRRHVGIDLQQEEVASSSDQSLTDEDRVLVLESCVRELLFEREGIDERFDLCLRLFHLVQDRKSLQPRDFEGLVPKLEAFGFETTQSEIKELWFLIVREARRRYDDRLKEFGLTKRRDVLPPISKGTERELLHILRESSYHTKLRFRRGDLGFATKVLDQLGNAITVNLPVENTPLASALLRKD